MVVAYSYEPSGSAPPRYRSILLPLASGRELPLLEMVLDLPEVVDAEPVGELDLLQGVGEQSVLVVWRPRPRHLALVEDPESHVVRSLPVTVGDIKAWPGWLPWSGTGSWWG
jgi:hypothetical protein